MRQQIQRGEFRNVREHLRKEIHQLGSLYASPDELLVHVTGEKMNPVMFIKYLERKYKSLYHLE